MSDTDKDKPLEQESKKFLETDTVTPSVPEKKVDKKVKVDGKKKSGFNIPRILYLLVIIVFCVGTVLYFRHFNELYFNGPPPPPDDKMSQIPNILPYYVCFIVYPPGIVKDAGIGAFLFLVTLYLCFDFILFEKLSGWMKTASLILSIVIILAGTEFVMDFYVKVNPVLNRPHTTLFWELSPDIMDINLGPAKVLTNSHGFRSPDISTEKPKGQYRIMVLGDSSAFGHFVENDETFGAVLVKMLRFKHPGRNIRFINAAVIGYTTYQGITFMKERGWNYSPDLIIVSFNDDPQLEWKEDLERVPTRAILPIFRVLYKSNIYLSIKKHLLNSRLEKDPSFARQPMNNQMKNRVPPEQMKANLEYLMDEAKKRNTQIIVISMPLQSSSPGIEIYRKVMEELSKDRGYPFLDLLHTWQKYPPHEVFLDVMHPSVKGHKVIAEDLFKIIEDNNIIDKQKVDKGE